MPTAATSAPVHEVEVKYWVADLDALLIALNRVGVRLGDPVLQDDQAYAPASWSYGMAKEGVPFARLRTEADTHLFTVKVPRENELACLEHETVVADRPQMHRALLAMGFMPTMRIIKTRLAGRWGKVLVCVDTVADLGIFVELEDMVNTSLSGETAQAELDAMVRSLGVETTRTTQTYDSLMHAAG